MEIQGIKLNEREVDEDLLIDELTDSLINITKEIVGHKYDGVVILIDEAETMQSWSLGTFLKKFFRKTSKNKNVNAWQSASLGYQRLEIF